MITLRNPRALTRAPSVYVSVVAPCDSHSTTLHSERSSYFTISMDIDPARRNKKPRLLLETEREKLDEFVDSIHYSARYNDDKFEYRHVQLPKNMLKKIPTDYFDSSKGTLKLLWEEEWRALGITQSLGWEHYEVHEPEPHILLFKRPLNYQPPLQQ
ncbi:Cyclin-dependent kinase, regulatory subunit [Penicillium digitatum]|uniref:Cyclin-dependent kinases regulatory subunit n=1 Tax=Penicillium digitatum TaxID=36651 RepID=A0A7T6XQF3_PENDI|nr:Cyclin-dependent kinase, regulatory subunit [Penicillium digitatum]